MQVCGKVEKSSITVLFHWFVGSGGSKIRLAKTACAEPSGEMKDEKLHAVVARSTFPSQHVQYKAPHARTPFGSCGAKHILLWRAELLHFHVVNFEN